MRAGVVHRDEAAEPGVTRLGVDLDHREVGAERERRAWRREVGLGLPAPSPSAAERRPSRPTVAGVPATWKRPRVGVEHDVVGRRLEQVGGPLAGERRRSLPVALAIAAPPICTEREPPVRPPDAHQVGVAVDDLDVVDRHARAVGHDHRPGGVVALAERRRTAAHAHAALRRAARRRRTRCPARPP